MIRLVVPGATAMLKDGQWVDLYLDLVFFFRSLGVL